MRLVLIKELARMGGFESEAAIRAMIQRGELRKGIHYFQRHPGGRIRLDADAVFAYLRGEDVKTQDQEAGKIPLRKGGYLHEPEAAACSADRLLGRHN